MIALFLRFVVFSKILKYFSLNSFPSLFQISSFLLALPQCLDHEINHYASIASQNLEIFREKVVAILNGEKKRRVCEWWLSHIEERVDDFLIEWGFVLDALPRFVKKNLKINYGRLLLTHFLLFLNKYNRDYTDLPPTDLWQVRKNHALLLWLLGSYEDQLLRRGGGERRKEISDEEKDKSEEREEEETENGLGDLLPFLKTREKYEECQKVIVEFVRGVTCEVYEQLNQFLEVCFDFI